MGQASDSRSVHRAEVPELLRVLELNGLPQPEQLERQFKDLIKRYHPDRNRHRQEWANERSRAVLYAARRLRSYLQDNQPLRGQAGGFRSGAGAVRAAQHGSSAGSDARAARRSMRDDPAAAMRRSLNALPFQLIEWQDLGYALPIPNIVRILGPGDAALRRDDNAAYVFYNREIYPLQSSFQAPGGRAAAWQDCGYVVLLRGQRERVALVLHRHARFTAIELISLREIRQANPDLPTHEPFLRAPHGHRMYLCPGPFLRETLQSVVPAGV